MIGILLPNIVSLADLHLSNSESEWTWEISHLFFKGRFFPIFAVVFGVSLHLFCRNARDRGTDAKKLLIKRLLWLLVFGIPHQIFHPGEALLFFTIFGLVLLPIYDLSPRVVLAIAIVLLSLSIPTTSAFTVPGLICLGVFLGKTEYFENLKRYRRSTVIAWILSLILVVPLCYLQFQQPKIHRGTLLTLAGFAMATCFVTSIILLPGSTRILKPLAASGRMALSVYLSQTLAILTIHSIHPIFPNEALYVWGAIGVTQIAATNLWLRYFAMGPFEWLWRWMTYGPRPSWRE